MSAEQLIKTHGVSFCKTVVESAQDGEGFYCPCCHEYFEKPEAKMQARVSRLKQLVERHELVEWHGGLKYAKSYFERNSKQYPDAEGWDELKQAIADVEACQ